MAAWTVTSALCSSFRCIGDVDYIPGRPNPSSDFLIDTSIASPAVGEGPANRLFRPRKAYLRPARSHKAHVLTAPTHCSRELICCNGRSPETTSVVDRSHGRRLRPRAASLRRIGDAYACRGAGRRLCATVYSTMDSRIMVFSILTYLTKFPMCSMRAPSAGKAAWQLEDSLRGL